MKDQRVKLVEAIADRILDLENAGAVTSKLTFADERSDVESIMSDARVTRANEEARLAEQERIAEEKRVAEAAKAAEEAKAADEARAKQQADTTPSTSSTNTQRRKSRQSPKSMCNHRQWLLFISQSRWSTTIQSIIRRLMTTCVRLTRPCYKS